MKAKYVTNGTYVDYWLCPECEEDMPVAPAKTQVECPHCERKWTLNYDYSFEEGRWRNCTTITPRA